MPRNLKATEKKKVRDFLKAHGHDKDRVDKLKLDTDEELRTEMLALHGVSTEQYRQVTGKG